MAPRSVDLGHMVVHGVPDNVTDEMLRRQYPAPAAPEPSSAYRRALRGFLDFDLGKTISSAIDVDKAGKALSSALTPHVATILEVAGNYGPFTAPVRTALESTGLIPPTTGPLVTPEGARQAAEIITPQDTPGWIALAATPGLRGLGYMATKGGSHVLGPALSVGTGYGLLGGATAANEGTSIPWGAAKGFVSGFGSELLMPVLSTLGKGLPTVRGRVAQNDLTNVVRAMEESVPPFRKLAADRGLDLSNPVTLSRMAKQGQLVDALRQYARVGETTITNQIGHVPVVIPALGPTPSGSPSRSFAQAWQELSEYGLAGYKGSKIDPNVRTAQGLLPREVWQEGTDQMMQQLLNLDRSGRAIANFDEVRRAFGAGRFYIDMFNAPGVISSKGHWPSFDTIRAQAWFKGKIGQAEHRDFLGNIAGGRLGRPEASYDTYWATLNQPRPMPPGAPSPGAPSPAGPPTPAGPSVADTLAAARARNPGWSGPNALPEQPALPPGSSVWDTLEAARARQPGWSGPNVLPPPPTPTPPGALPPPPPMPPSPPPPGGPQVSGGWRNYYRPESSEAPALQDALTRGARAGYEAKDYDVGADWLGWLKGVPRLLTGIVGFPNVGRVYVGGYGRVPMMVPPGAQSAIDYAAWRAAQESMRGQPEGP